MGDADLTNDLSTTAKGLATIAPLTGPAAPVVAMIAGLVSLGASLSGVFAGCGPSCEHDTQEVEGFAMAFHNLWYAMTGEALPGIPGVSVTTIPGQYGAQGIDLFRKSNYPNVPFPYGAPGAPTAENAIASLNATFQQVESSLVRTQSVANLKGNYDYFLSLLQEYAANQANAPASMGTLTAGTIGASIGNWWTGLSGWGQAAVAACGVAAIGMAVSS